jgi:hypothetical protein
VHVAIPEYGIAKVSAHALVGGYFSTQNGGTFINGAVIGGLNQAIAPLIDQIDIGAGQSIMRVGASAAFGAGLAAITGDDVLNGALIAAYSRAYNDHAVWLEVLKNTADFSAGFGDTVTFGLTSQARKQLWGDGGAGVDSSSGFNMAGSGTGVVTSFVLAKKPIFGKSSILFKPGGLLNTGFGGKFRIGWSRLRNQKVFRISGSWVPKSWENGHIYIYKGAKIQK